MFSRYGFFGSLRLVFSLLYTKVMFPKAKIIRLPFDIRNKKFIEFGSGFTTGIGCRIEALPIDKNIKKCLIVGQGVQINDYVHLAAVKSLVIGNNVLIASKVFISDHNHGSYTEDKSDSPNIPPIQRELVCKPIFIDDNVWIGESCCVLPGVTIGKGCIIGALSVVTKNIPPYSIAAGSPARVLKQYNFSTYIWEKV